MRKMENLQKDLEESKAQCKVLEEKFVEQKTQTYIANAKRIRAEKEVSRLKMEIALLKEGILV